MGRINRRAAAVRNNWRRAGVPWRAVNLLVSLPAVVIMAGWAWAGWWDDHEWVGFAAMTVLLGATFWMQWLAKRGNARYEARTTSAD